MSAISPCKFNDVYKVAISSIDSLADFCNIACEKSIHGMRLLKGEEEGNYRSIYNIAGLKNFAIPP
jgi:hypothetical protein